MLDWAATSSVALACFVLLYLRRRALRTRSPYPLPPGPPGLPWFGNVIGVNADAPWLTYAEWAKQYGDLVYSRLFGKDIIIINSHKIAKDLLEIRSRNYSDRPTIVTSELCGLDFNSVLRPYGDQWRLHRRFFHQTFRLNAVDRFRPCQHRRTCHLLQQLLETPEKVDEHIFQYTTSVILNSVYNYDPASPKDNIVDMMAKVLTVAVHVLRLDVAVMVGAFPWLLYLPSCFPGMAFKRQMAVIRSYSGEYLERPFKYSLEKSGSAAPSMVQDALRHLEEKRVSPEGSWFQALKGASGTAFLAASETSNSVLMTFFLMMVVNPEVQAKAQAQIDRVVGRNRLPNMEDRPLLPFIDAILRETLRFSPVGPLSVPHAAVDDDVYNGFRIPKGAILLTNLWSMAHDETKYPNPHDFIPERFLNNDGSLKPNDTDHLAYGFGRRICVGKHFADSSIWVVIARVLAVFNILRPLDEKGIEMPVKPKFSSGLAVHPLPFRCRIIPRFEGIDGEKLGQLIDASTP